MEFIVKLLFNCFFGFLLISGQRAEVAGAASVLNQIAPTSPARNSSHRKPTSNLDCIDCRSTKFGVLSLKQSTAAILQSGALNELANACKRAGLASLEWIPESLAKPYRAELDRGKIPSPLDPINLCEAVPNGFREEDVLKLLEEIYRSHEKSAEIWGTTIDQLFPVGLHIVFHEKGTWSGQSGAAFQTLRNSNPLPGEGASSKPNVIGFDVPKGWSPKQKFPIGLYTHETWHQLESSPVTGEFLKKTQVREFSEGFAELGAYLVVENYSIAQDYPTENDLAWAEIVKHYSSQTGFKAKQSYQSENRSFTFLPRIDAIKKICATTLQQMPIEKRELSSANAQCSLASMLQARIQAMPDASAWLKQPFTGEIGSNAGLVDWYAMAAPAFSFLLKLETKLPQFSNQKITIPLLKDAANQPTIWKSISGKKVPSYRGLLNLIRSKLDDNGKEAFDSLWKEMRMDAGLKYFDAQEVKSASS